MDQGYCRLLPSSILNIQTVKLYVVTYYFKKPFFLILYFGGNAKKLFLERNAATSFCAVNALVFKTEMLYMIDIAYFGYIYTTFSTVLIN